MASILDQYNDPTFATLHVLTRNRPLARDLLKAASFDKVAAQNLPSTAYAWPEETRLPVHTRADTVASILYRSKLAGVPPHVDATLAKAAEIYAIPDELFAGMKIARTEKPSEYALPDQKRLPLDNVEQIKLAEEVLCRDFTRLDLPTRADAFSRLVKAAKANDVTLAPISQRLAGLTTCNVPKLATWLGARAAATTGAVSEAFDKLASAISKQRNFITDRKDLIKLAGTIQRLDEKAGLEKHYDRKLPDPMLTVFNSEKVAEEMCDLGGSKVACSKLMSLPADMWDQVDASEMGKLAEDGDVVQFKQAFETLPLDIKVALRSYL